MVIGLTAEPPLSGLKLVLRQVIEGDSEVILLMTSEPLDAGAEPGQPTELLTHMTSTKDPLAGDGHAPQ